MRVEVDALPVQLQEDGAKSLAQQHWNPFLNISETKQTSSREKGFL